MQLAISTTTILKEGVVGVKNSTVNRKSVEQACFCFCFFFVFCFLFVLFLSFVCLFVFLFVLFCFFLNHLAQALNWYQKKNHHGKQNEK